MKVLEPIPVECGTGKVKSGENRLEVLIYNTLGNYYLTTPSQYVGSTRSGLIGPVKLLIE